MHEDCITFQGFVLRQVCREFDPSEFQPWIADLDFWGLKQSIARNWANYLHSPSLMPNARQSSFKNFRNWRSCQNSLSLYRKWNCPWRTFCNPNSGSLALEEVLQSSSCWLRGRWQAFSQLFFLAILQSDLKMVENLFHGGKQLS